ncbi:MAG: hypothetical protein QOD74_2737 [Variibacter sp.]|jgi:hypothetical protein|nr:hypothetical protein [Variibacter sp.]
MQQARSGAGILRRAIDAGRTGDKVDFPDLATAPLGTDEEAAGTPLTREQVRTAVEQETRPGQAHAQQRGGGAAWVLIACVAVLAIATLALLRVF